MAKNVHIVADSGIPGVVEALSPYGRVWLRDTKELAQGGFGKAEILLVRSVVRVGKELLNGSAIRFVGSATAGCDHVDLDDLKGLGVTFAHAPGANADSVADHVLTALLHLCERDGVEPSSRTLGVVGCGQVGSRVLRRAKGLGMRVVACDPPRARAEHRAGDAATEWLELDELLQQVDALTLHVPLQLHGQDRTLHLMDETRLRRFEGWLINTSRGAVVDGDALKALKQQEAGPRRLVLDVWENEPTPDPELVAATDIATSHVAGYAADSKWEATRRMSAAVAGYLGQPVAQDPSPLKRVRLPSPARGPWSLLALAEAMCPLLRDDAHLREAVRSDPPAEAFEALRSRYAGRRLMREHDVPAHDLPDGLVAERALGVRLV